MLSQPESGMYQSDAHVSYSKRERTPEPNLELNSRTESEKLYVGYLEFNHSHLPYQITKRELEDLFGAYGGLANVEIKHGGYAFIQYGIFLVNS